MPSAARLLSVVSLTSLCLCFASASVDDLLAKADAHRDSHDFAAAAQEYTAYLKTHPKSLQALTGRAKAYLGLGILAGDPKDSTKQFDLARADFKQVHVLEPKNEKAYIEEIVVCNSVFGSYETLVPTVELGLKNLPNSYNLMELKVSMHYKLGKPDVVRRTLNDIVRLFPSRYEPLAQRGQLNSEEGKHEDAVADYTKSIDLCKSKSVLTLLEFRCREYIALRNYDAATSDTEQAIKQSPESWVFYGLRGGITLNRPLKGKTKDEIAAEVKGIVDSAFPDVDKAVSKGYVEFVGYRADCYFYFKKYDLALQDYQKYAETSKDSHDNPEWKRRDAARLNCLIALARNKQ